jgi:hypothetical protein
MDLSFTHLPDGVIEISVGRSDGLFTMAMNDSVSSRAPRGSATPGLSTYWIDRVEAAAQSAREHRSAEPFASGNVTYLRLDGDEVIAAFDFDPAEIDAESMPLESFLRALREWRGRVIEAGGASDSATR